MTRGRARWRAPDDQTTAFAAARPSFGIQVVWLALRGVLGLVGRLDLRRPWRVDAIRGVVVRSRFVRGFRAAGRTCDEPADAFAAGADPSPSGPATVPH